MAVPPMKLTGNNFNTVFSDGTRHRGTDITPTQGNDAVVSPVVGRVIEAKSTGAGSAGPTGFGPAWVKIQAKDDASIHTLAHLDPNAPMPVAGEDVDEGEQVGLIARGVAPSKFHSGVPHVHWQVNIPPAFDTVDPVAWLQGKTGGKPATSSPWWLWLIVGWALVRATDRRR